MQEKGDLNSGGRIREGSEEAPVLGHKEGGERQELGRGGQGSGRTRHSKRSHSRTVTGGEKAWGTPWGQSEAKGAGVESSCR